MIFADPMDFPSNPDDMNIPVYFPKISRSPGSNNMASRLPVSSDS
jgi:hypothetical protein